MSTPKHRLFQGFRPLLAICVTFFTPTAGVVAANQLTPDGLPAALVAGEPTLRLISPVDGRALESYSPTRPARSGSPKASSDAARMPTMQP